MRALRININTPWAFIIVGLFGGEVQRRLPNGRYGDDWTWLAIEPPLAARDRAGVGARGEESAGAEPESS